MRARLLSAPEECRRKVHPAQVKLKCEKTKAKQTRVTERDLECLNKQPQYTRFSITLVVGVASWDLHQWVDKTLTKFLVTNIST